MDRGDVVFLLASLLVASGCYLWYAPAGLVAMGVCVFGWLLVSQLFGVRK